jgi:hypothetical protein
MAKIHLHDLTPEDLVRHITGKRPARTLWLAPNWDEVYEAARERQLLLDESGLSDCKMYSTSETQLDSRNKRKVSYDDLADLTERV